MHVDYRLYGELRAAGEEWSGRLDLPADSTVGDALAELARTHPAVESVPVVLVNGRHVRHLDGRSTPLADGDVVSLSSSAMPE